MVINKSGRIDAGNEIGARSRGTSVTLNDPVNGSPSRVDAEPAGTTTLRPGIAVVSTIVSPSGSTGTALARSSFGKKIGRSISLSSPSKISRPAGIGYSGHVGVRSVREPPFVPEESQRVRRSRGCQAQFVGDQLAPENGKRGGSVGREWSRALPSAALETAHAEGRSVPLGWLMSSA